MSDNVKHLDLALIRTDGGTQPRTMLDDALIDEYAEALRNGAEFPPIIVYDDGANYWLTDGFHRVHAAARCDLATIAAEVHFGTLAEAQWFSYSVNQTHGLRRTNEDKRRAVEAALRHPFAGRYSSREIARHCGVSHMTIERARDAICNIVTDERIVTRGNGQQYTMNTANIGKRAEPDGQPLTTVAAEDDMLAMIQTVDADEEPAEIGNRPHVAYNSGNNEWYTPADYIAAAQIVLGRIDLDPASTATANAVVKAASYYTAEDDGLCQSWHGNVWMNPPYASEFIGAFCAKLVEHVKRGDVPQAIVLVNNATETAWFARLISVASAVCFPLARVKFWSPDRIATPLQGQAVIYIGGNPAGFRQAFASFGWTAQL